MLLLQDRLDSWYRLGPISTEHHATEWRHGATGKVRPVGLLDYDEEAEPLVNIATGLHRIGKALYDLSHSTGSEPTTIEYVGMILRDEVSRGLSEIAEALRDRGDNG